jgi:signal transduction histidine kinase/HD-like signal output (HDOD) protein
LPQVLVHILEVMQGDEMSFPQLAERIRHDSAISARLLAIANSTPNAATTRSPTIDRALLVLGIDTIKTVVITTAIRQFFNGFAREQQSFLKAFWRRSLMMASGAQKLAHLTGYHAPDQAYLTGLLTDVGQLLLLQQHGQSYLDRWHAAVDDGQLLMAEQEGFDKTHPEAGAALIAGWQVDPTMIDAIYRHHDNSRSLTDNHHLVKIINLASRLSDPGPTAADVDTLFGFSDDFLASLQVQISDDARQLAQAMDIDTDDGRQTDSEHAHHRLGQQIAQISELAQARTALKQAADGQDVYLGIRRLVHIMLGAGRSLLFLRQPGQPELRAAMRDFPQLAADTRLPLEPGRSIVSDAFLKNRIIDSNERTVLTAFDRSLLRDCLSQRLLCIPLPHDGELLGVLVLGMDAPLPMPPPALAALCREIAATLAKHESSGTNAARLQLHIEEAIHEAGNPLSIIGNYLEMLRLKLGDEHQATKDILMIRQEIDRVGSILLQLKEPAPLGRADAALDINALIGQLSQIFKHSIFAARKLTLELRLDPRLPPITADASSIKQIMINLIKNAAEALDESGIVIISTEMADARKDGRSQVAITIEDNGPGIPEAIRDTLFSPAASTKGSGHAGLGLSITKRLVEELGGTITCFSGAWGSRFHILIPQC